MKRFWEYDVTEEEMQEMSSRGRADYESRVRFLKETGDYQYEKLCIAMLLHIRGDREGSRKMIESIEDESYRRCCWRDYSGWECAAKGLLLV